MVDWVKQLAFYNVGGPHPISFPTIGQNTSQPPAQQNSTNCLWTLSVTSALPSSAADCRQTGTGHQLSCISSLLAHPADFGFTSLCNCVSQFLIVNFFIYTYTYIHTHTHAHIFSWFNMFIICFSENSWLIHIPISQLCLTLQARTQGQ